jgi:hypothetical protein
MKSFDDRYSPQDAPSGEPVWTHAETLTQPLTHVWTLVDGERGRTYAVAGYHVVNAFGYTVTERPWVRGDEQGRWS